jgi:NAD(P)H-flavin reductase
MANPVKIPAIVSKMKSHDVGIYTLELTPEKRVPRFKAGQFLHLTIDDYDPQGGYWPESRVFSIASAPSSNTVEIVYSVKGRYTTRMSNEIVEGKQVWLKLPYGDFSIETAVAPDQDIVLVAGGTGVSPFISYLRKSLDNSDSPGRQIRLIYGLRKIEHLLYFDTLKACETGLKGFAMDIFLEDCGAPDFKHCKGTITLEHIVECGKSLRAPAYFLSGPPGMIKKFKNGLIGSLVKPENIKIDEWE